MTTFYLDPLNGNNANNGSSWALAWRDFTNGASAARIAPSDIIRIAKSPDPTSLGQNATWTNLSRTVTLTSAVTANISTCETAWTASANVTCTTSSTRKEGSLSASFAFAAGFTTGLAAYITIASTDFSAYQQVSFWIRTTVAIASGTLTLTLCSDTAGVTAVNTIPIPAIPATAQWQQVSVDTGGALGSAIQSVALNALLDPTTPTILIDNVLACKASSSNDSLTLSSLISKNSLAQGGTEGWYGIKSINGTTITLDNDTNSGSGSGQGYSGTTETVTLYKRECFRTTPATNTSTAAQEIMDNGTSGNNIQYQGGYNTSNDAQDGETFFDGQNGYGYGIYRTAKSFTTINYISTVRYYGGIVTIGGSTYNTIDNLSNSNNNSQWGIFDAGSGFDTFNNIINCNNNGNAGIQIGNGVNNNIINSITNINNNTLNGIYIDRSNNNIIGTITNANNNGNNGINLGTASNNTFTTISNVKNNASFGIALAINSCNNTFKTISNVNSNQSGIDLRTYSNNNIFTTVSNANSNNSYGVYISGAENNKINFLSTASNLTAGVYQYANTNYFKNSINAESIKFSTSTLLSFANMMIFSEKDQQTNYSKIYTDGGNIVSQASTLTNGSGTEWKFTTETNTNRQSNYPLSLVLVKLAVNANALVTVSCYFKKGHATNIGARLMCKGGQIAGVTGDVSSTASSSTSEEQLTITFTPTEAGVVEITAEVFYVAGHSTVIVDGLTFSQA